MVFVGEQDGKLFLVQFIYTGFNILAQHKGDEFLLLIVEQGKEGGFGDFGGGFETTNIQSNLPGLDLWLEPKKLIFVILAE